MQVITQTTQLDIGGERGILHRYLEASRNLCLSDNPKLWKFKESAGEVVGQLPRAGGAEGQHKTREDLDSGGLEGGWSGRDYLSKGDRHDADPRGARAPASSPSVLKSSSNSGQWMP